MHFSEIIHMGGFGCYVWPAYLATFFIFGFNVFLALFEKKRAHKIVKKFFSEKEYHEL